jgi:hypothetical protein
MGARSLIRGVLDTKVTFQDFGLFDALVPSGGEAI